VFAIGGPGEPPLVWKEEALRAPAAGEVLVEHRRTGVSFGNLMVESSARGKASRTPTVLGYEAIGVVRALGPGVEGLRVGQRAGVFTGGSGGYATAGLWKAKDVFALPDGVSDDAAVAVMLNYATGYQALKAAKVSQRQRLFFTAASGGVGTAIADLCRVLEVQGIGAASARKFAPLRAMGIECVDYKDPKWKEEVRRLAPEGVDVVVDGVGGGMELDCLDVLKRPGHAVSYGMRSANASGAFVMGPIIWGLVRFLSAGLKPGVHIHPYFINWSKQRDPVRFRQDVEQLLQWIAEGRLAPMIAGVFGLSEAALAHQRMLEGDLVGKLVLDCTR